MRTTGILRPGLVGMEGFEPSQDCSYTLLKRTRIPIPPHAHYLIVWTYRESDSSFVIANDASYHEAIGPETKRGPTGNRTPASSMPWTRNTILLWAHSIYLYQDRKSTRLNSSHMAITH